MNFEKFHDFSLKKKNSVWFCSTISPNENVMVIFLNYKFLTWSRILKYFVIFGKTRILSDTLSPA